MDIELNYKEFGRGEPLILLHGNGENLSYFKHQMEFFASFYRVIAIDTRGHGTSPRGDAPFTLSQFAEDLKNFLDSRSISRANILGFSDGGNIALLFSLKYPEYVLKLILNGANFNPGGIKASVRFSILMNYIFTSFICLFNKNASLKRELLSLMIDQPNISVSDLKRLQMPVLLIAGTKDMIKHTHTEKMYRSIPHCALSIIEGDHFIAEKESEKFNQSVLRFLEISGQSSLS